MKYLIGIDIGTSGTKSVLFNTDGSVVRSSSAEYPLYQPQNGWAEQSPEDWWEATVTTLKAITEGINAADIAGIGLSGQMHGLVMLDSENSIIRPAIIWCDGRTGAECVEITERIGAERLIELTANPALTGFTASKIMWVKNHEPENYARCRKILLPKDYIRFRLSGTFAAEMSDAAGMQLLNVRERRWSDEVLDKLGIDRELLADVFEAPYISSYVSDEAAALTGLKAGTPIAGGAGDNAAAAVGTGTVVDGRAFTTIGTSGVVYAHTSQMLLDPGGRIHTFCSAVPGEWHVMGVTQSAGLSLRWFRDTFCEEEKKKAAKLGCDPYDIMTSEAAKSPIGCSRLLYLPYLMGERTPHLDSNARGVFFGLSAVHDKKDMIRAVLEGVSFALNDSAGILRGIGAEISDMTLCGGGAASPMWRRMLCDIFGCPVKITVSKEGAALGAAILAGVGVGIWPSVPKACAELVTYREPMTPDPAAGVEYAKYYEIYRSLYHALRESYAKLAEIK